MGGGGWVLKLRFQRTDLGRGLGLDAQKQPEVASVWYRRVVLPTRSVCNRAQVHHQNPIANTSPKGGEGPTTATPISWLVHRGCGSASTSSESSQAQADCP